MRRFVIGAIVGAGLMYFFLFQYADWKNWARGGLGDISAQYRGDAGHRRADQALR